jgi:hypothetical protein
MTRRVLTTMGSATAVAAVLGGCLLLGPTPLARADVSGTSGNSSGSISTTNGVTTITGKSGSSTGTVKFGSGTFCVMGFTLSGSGSFGCK